ncbi:hypothetical protein [Nitrosomonas sp.]|uniref:hypothetical protein n=1 Tax=Nitrosomonas sp. TaxID=42353 RepID=UPI0025D637F9|nr:hypothetical protein [Nitrosomonas sp.]
MKEVDLKKILAVTLGFIAAAVMAGGVDQRQVLSVNEMQRHHLLGEMRMLLTGTSAILEALAKEDMTAVARHARSLGMAMPHKMEGHMDNFLPEQFMQMGMGMHQAFDRIADEAESGKDPKHTLQQLSEALGRCTACHATYQVGLNQQSGGDDQSRGQGKQGAHSHAH